MQNSMRLDDLLGRELRLQWFESVAIVLAACRQLIHARRSDGFPPTQAITIDADGQVAVRGLSSSGDAVPNAAQMLSALLAHDFPVQLRLFMGQAADGAFGSLEEFASALAYYERPDAGQVLRSLYERASRAARRPGSESPVPEPEPVRLAAPVPAEATTRGERWPLVAAGVFVALIAGSIWVLEFGSGSVQVDAAIGTVKGTLSRTLGVVSADSLVEPPAVEVPIEAGTATKTARAAAARPPASPSRPDAVPALLVDSRSSPLFTPSLLRSDALPATDPAEPDTRFYSTMAVVAGAGEGGGAAEDSARIYTRQDQDVIPPRAVYPKLPAAPDSALTAGLTVVDLVIDQTGHVEGARLRTPPRNVHEFMLVSAAKAWRFDPAVHEDGHPVRFRHSVVISAYP